MAASVATAAETLQLNPLPMLRRLNVVESDEEVVLQGRVESYYQKQLAQEAILPLLGRRVLRNLVRVQAEG